MEALIDTSFLMLMAEKGRNIISMIEDKLNDCLEPIILKSVIDELVKLSKQKGKRALYAKTALEISLGMKIIDAGIDASTDEQLVKLSKNTNLIVVTSDFEMSRKLRETKCRYIYVNRVGKIHLNL
ncbi:MAG: hypothetical protein QXQ33_04730 [Nitrososphaerota archaeon]